MGGWRERERDGRPKEKSIWVLSSLSVLQSSQIEGLKWRLDTDPESQVTKKTQTQLKQVGGKEGGRKERKKESNNCMWRVMPSPGDCHSAIDLTKLQIPSQDPPSPLHLAKDGILIPRNYKAID